MTTYKVAERFKSVQGEGMYAGTPMAFVRFAGCSVGKKVCLACDTDYDRIHPWRGGGEYSPQQLHAWAWPHTRFCLTGGEPLDQDLRPLLAPGLDSSGLSIAQKDIVYHIETSGTVPFRPGFLEAFRSRLWICVSPKPGYLSEMIGAADEIKVIVPGLGLGDGWPTLEDALGWAKFGRLVYLQPGNRKHEIDQVHLMHVMDLVREHPQLRLSVQLHKLLRVQ